MRLAAFGHVPALVLALWLAAGPALGGEERGLEPGVDAPALDVSGWVNVAPEKAPTADSLTGKVVLVEFWETTCGPCVRSMPKVQELADRYAARGLVVVAISSEAAITVEAWAHAHGIAFPMGCDPAKRVISAYRFPGYPTTYLIGKDGKIAYRGNPAGAEAAVEKALGLESDPGKLLAAYVASLAGKDSEATKAAIERLLEKASATFDLAAWARATAGTEGKGGPGTPLAGKALTDWTHLAALADAAKRDAALQALVGAAPASFDLAAWTRDTIARDFPPTARDLRALVAAGRLDALLDLVLDRRPAASVLDAVVKDRDVSSFAAKHAAEERDLGRRGLMALHWPLSDKLPKDKDANERFWNELASNGWIEDVATKKLLGLDLAGTNVFKPMLPAWIDRRFARSLLMEAFAMMRRPDLAKLAADVAKARDAVLADLRKTYPVK